MGVGIIDKDCVLKTCNRCLETKNLHQFYKSKKYKDGYLAFCKDCNRNYDQSRCSKHSGPKIDGDKLCSSCQKVLSVSDFTKRLRNKDGLRSRCKYCDRRGENDYRKRNPESDAKRKLKQKYNLSLEEYKRMVSAQENKCYICGKIARLNVDHNHKTGQVRKLLCHKCNAGIGMFDENITILEQTILYIKEHNNEQ